MSPNPQTTPQSGQQKPLNQGTDANKNQGTDATATKPNFGQQGKPGFDSSGKPQASGRPQDDEADDKAGNPYGASKDPNAKNDATKKYGTQS